MTFPAGSDHRAVQAAVADYRQLLGMVDDWFAGCRLEAGERIRCGTGCSQCCRGLFDISLLDAWLLRLEFDRLPAASRRQPLALARRRAGELARQWPGFGPPYRLNVLADEAWTEMPEEDEEPCPLLDSEGRCQVYAARPLICRLHGLPNIDYSGEVFQESGCTLNQVDDRMSLQEGLRWRFREVFQQEIEIFHRFTRGLLGHPFREWDTFIPLALLIDFSVLTGPAKNRPEGVDEGNSNI